MTRRLARFLSTGVGVLFLLFGLLVASALNFGPWWQPHYGTVGMRFHYLDKNPTALANFTSEAIKHLEVRGMIHCAPPAQFGDGRVGTPTHKGELVADCYWFKSPTFDGYFRLASWGDPLFASGLDAVGRTRRPPLGASSTFMALVDPTELAEWDAWALKHGAYPVDDVGRR